MKVTGKHETDNGRSRRVRLSRRDARRDRHCWRARLRSLNDKMAGPYDGKDLDYEADAQ